MLTTPLPTQLELQTAGPYDSVFTSPHIPPVVFLDSSQFSLVGLLVGPTNLAKTVPFSHSSLALFPGVTGLSTIFFRQTQLTDVIPGRIETALVLPSVPRPPPPLDPARGGPVGG